MSDIVLVVGDTTDTEALAAIRNLVKEEHHVVIMEPYEGTQSNPVQRTCTDMYYDNGNELYWYDFWDGLDALEVWWEFKRKLQHSIFKMVLSKTSPFIYIKRFYRRTLCSISGWLVPKARRKQKDQDN